MSKSDFVCDTCFKDSLLQNSNTLEDSSPVESKPYTCSLCNRNFPKSFNDEVDVGHSEQTKQLVEEDRYEFTTSEDDMLSKASTHSDDEKNLCPLCNAEFGTLYDLLNHNCNNSVPQKINECETNEKLSSNLCNEEHLTLHEEVDEVPLERRRHFLDNSRYELSTSEDLKSSTHLESTNHSCTSCNAELVALQDFLNPNCDDSVEKKTNKSETYEKHSSNLCNAECLAFYDEVDEGILERTRHFLEDSRHAESASENAKSSTHLKSEKPLCPSCNAKFATLHDLLNHSCNDSVQQKTNECENCEKHSSNLCNEEYLTLYDEGDAVSFEQARRHFLDDSRFELSTSEHVKYSTHLEIEKQSSSSCNVEFLTSYDLENHKCNNSVNYSVQQETNECETDKTNDKLIQCEICGREFSRKRGLERHMVVHTGEKPFECEVCGNKYSCKENLDRHKPVHSREKFKCDVCGKQYSQKQKLKSHMLTHSRE